MNPLNYFFINAEIQQNFPAKLLLFAFFNCLFALKYKIKLSSEPKSTLNSFNHCCHHPQTCFLYSKTILKTLAIKTPLNWHNSPLTFWYFFFSFTSQSLQNFCKTPHSKHLKYTSNFIVFWIIQNIFLVFWLSALLQCFKLWLSVFNSAFLHISQHSVQFCNCCLNHFIFKYFYCLLLLNSSHCFLLSHSCCQNLYWTF